MEQNDVAQIENLLAIVYNVNSSQSDRLQAQEILKGLVESPDGWRMVPNIIETSHSTETLFFALQILSNVIEFKWKTLPIEQRMGMRCYLLNKLAMFCSNESLYRDNKLFIGKLNQTLVQIIKQEWPDSWEGFIGDIVSSSKSSPLLCYNAFSILSSLADEIFEGKNKMTMAKTKKLKAEIGKEIILIYSLCDFSLSHYLPSGHVNSSTLTAWGNIELITTTLSALQSFLPFIPQQLIINSNMLIHLLTKIADKNQRNSALKCLIEIVNILKIDSDHVGLLLLHIVSSLLYNLSSYLPHNIDVKGMYEKGSSKDKTFLLNLALFLTSLFKAHLRVFESYLTDHQPLPSFSQSHQNYLSLHWKIDHDNPTPEHTFLLSNQSLISNELIKDGLIKEGMIHEAEKLIKESHHYLIQLTTITDEEVLKITMEYWFSLVEYLSHDSHFFPSRSIFTIPIGNKLLFDRGRKSKLLAPIYAPSLRSLRQIVILQMPKPEEVLISEDDNGELIVEESPDTSAIAFYQLMRDTLIYLTHLNPQETLEMIHNYLIKFSSPRQSEKGGWSWGELNAICWSIGSISGAQSEEEEKKILVKIFKELLNLSDKEKQKQNKAIVATNIMYIVGQYPRFLNGNWRFLHTVIVKLFDFMKEKEYGIQDMAIGTFLKIAKSCKSKFIVVQPMTTTPFINTILSNLPSFISPLSNHQQIANCYLAVAHIISAINDLNLKKSMIHDLMLLPNESFHQIINLAASSLNSLFDLNITKQLINVYHINLMTAIALGTSYMYQLEPIFQSTLHLYSTYSSQLPNLYPADYQLTNQQRDSEISTPLIRSFRAIKSEILKVLKTFFENSKDHHYLTTEILPSLFEVIFDDYIRNTLSRDPDVLSLLNACVTSLKATLNNDIPRIFQFIISPTVSMIQTNFEDFPDYRSNLFTLLRSINAHCFAGLLALSGDDFKLVINSFIWAFKHPTKSIADLGLMSLYEVWVNVQQTDFANAFYQTFLIPLLHDLLAVLTDTFHKSGFKMQATLLIIIISTIKSGKILVPLFDTVAYPQFNNQTYVMDYIVNMISRGLPNLSLAQVTSFVQGMFDKSQNLNEFKQHLRDFLVNMKEFEDADNSELYREEIEANEEELLLIKSLVPGLIKSLTLSDD